MATKTNIEINPEAAILRPLQAAAFIGVSKRTLYNLAETDPSFPRKIIFTSRCVGWRKESLEQWMEDKERLLN